MRTHRPPPHSMQLNHHSFLVPADDWPDSSDTEREVPTGQPHRPNTITRVNRLHTIHKSEGMSKRLAQEFANLLLILGEEERRKPREERGSLYHTRRRDHPLVSDDDGLKTTCMSKAQATHVLLSVAMSSDGCSKSEGACHRELAQAGVLALQSPPIWADRPTPVVDEMINPACTWHGPLVRERNDRLPSHDKKLHYSRMRNGPFGKRLLTGQ